MSQNESNKKLSTFFSELFRELSSDKNLKQAHHQLSNFIQTLIAQEEFVSNKNLTIGSMNIDNASTSGISQRKRLPDLLRNLHSKFSPQKQTILATIVYLSKDQQSQESFQNIQNQPLYPQDIKPQPELLIYYRNTFYLVPEYLTSGRNKSFVKQNDVEWKINLEKNIILTSEELQLDKYEQIVIQPKEYYPTYFPKRDFEYIKNERKYRDSFVRQNAFMDIQNLNYKKIFEVKQLIQDKYKQIMNQKVDSYKNNPEKQNELMEFNFLFKKKLQYLTKHWSSQKSAVRIGLVNQQKYHRKRHSDQSTPTLFIYNKFQAFQSLKKDTHFQVNLSKQASFIQNNDSFNELRIVKELLLLNMIYQKNRKPVEKILDLRQNMSNDLYRSIKNKQNEIEITRKLRVDKIKNTTSLTSFESFSIQNFFKQWRSKINDKKFKKSQILSISPSDMFLTTDYKYTRMQCKFYISYEKINKNAKSQLARDKYRFLRYPVSSSTKFNQLNDNTNVHTQMYTFTFDDNLNDWSVTLSPSGPNQQISLTQSKSNKTSSINNLCFDLSQVRDFFTLKVVITPLKSKERYQSQKTNKIQGICTISKIQKLRMIGQNSELVLYETNEAHDHNDEHKQKTVGFLNLFYLIKQYLDVSMAETFKIQNYRRIKFLQNIGKIPANYFQSTPINYTPNQTPFFAKLLSTNQQSITNRNFQYNYVTLIQFLESQKIERRRALIIEKQQEKQQQQRKRPYNQRSNDGIYRNQSNSISPTNRSRNYKDTKDSSSFSRIQKYKEFFSTLKNQYLEKSKIRNGQQWNSPSRIRQTNQNQHNLINRSILFEVASSFDQISLKTFGLLSESLKASMHQAHKVHCPDAHWQTLGILSMIFSLNESNVQQIQVSVYQNLNASDQRDKKCIQLNRTQKNIKSLQYFNPFLVPLVNRIVTLYKIERTEFSDTQSLRSSSSIGQIGNQAINQTKVTQFTINFLSLLYPYFNPKALQKQSLYIRYFVQKYLPELNFNLNRKHIGLQNFISKYLLSLFTVDLQEEVTYQIWDFLFSCSNKFAGRINCILTLLIFLQKTNFHPVIPVSSFVNALRQNYKKFDFSNSAKKISDRMLQSLGQIYEKQHQRKSALYELRDEKGNLLIGNEFFKKVMFDSQRNNKVNYIGNKKVNLNNLPYKLPQPKYYGYPVQEVKLLMRSMFISDTVSLNDWSLVVKWHNMTSSKIAVNNKNQNLNEFIRFKYPQQLKENSYDLPHLQFIISPKRDENKFFIGYLPIINLHKDYVYCQEVRLIYVKGSQVQLSNKGENILNVQLILKSRQCQSDSSKDKSTKLQTSRASKIQATTNNTNLRLQKQYYANEQKRLDLLYDRLLDYDLQEQNNDAIKEMKKLKMLFQKMKNPIDQFTHQKYDKLKIPSVGDITFPEVVMNSQLLIEHFQVLIQQTFPDSKKLKVNLPEIYKMFSKNTNYQMVFLTEILIEAVLIDKNITFEQKIEYLYCLGKHYQNTGGTGLTIQTIDFIFQYIYKTYGWLTGVPYSKQGKGQILKGVIYTQGVKVKQEGLDITSILRDWAHVCKIKCGHLDLVLGDAVFLTQLRALLPLETLQSLQKSNRVQQLRIEIIYTKNQSQYIWSACVNIKDFKIKEVGTKFLQRYPPQQQLHSTNLISHSSKCSNISQLCWNQNNCQGCSMQSVSLDTASEILYNCSHLISLESSNTINRSTFKNLFYTTPLISYLLHYSSVYEPISFNPAKTPIIKHQQFEEPNKFAQECNDWILYRYQNCIESWRPCNISKTQGQTRYVQLPQESLKVQNQIISILNQKYNLKISSQSLLYKAPLFQVWSMDENFVGNQSTEQSEDFAQRNKKNRKPTINQLGYPKQYRK